MNKPNKKQIILIIIAILISAAIISFPFIWNATKAKAVSVEIPIKTIPEIQTYSSTSEEISGAAKYSPDPENAPYYLAFRYAYAFNSTGERLYKTAIIWYSDLGKVSAQSGTIQTTFGISLTKTSMLGGANIVFIPKSQCYYKSYNEADVLQDGQSNEEFLREAVKSWKAEDYSTTSSTITFQSSGTYTPTSSSPLYNPLININESDTMIYTVRTTASTDNYTAQPYYLDLIGTNSDKALTIPASYTKITATSSSPTNVAAPDFIKEYQPGSLDNVLYTAADLEEDEKEAIYKDGYNDGLKDGKATAGIEYNNGYMAGLEAGRAEGTQSENFGAFIAAMFGTVLTFFLNVGNGVTIWDISLFEIAVSFIAIVVITKVVKNLV